ncbi:universal stress protein [Nonomuraea zeae]|uniref:Universal stress protein n=1 Tax=Nonomuraea zeae TaxID=1642303 RepID=A0A5S4GSA2_9ACTN|nr:universal stress protein [Nonomuraea zeae]TMR35793.1 universal stress protein [Nonomuraea zeae]
MIIVGADGSRAALEAAGWAAREAVLRGTALTVLHALPRWVVDTADGRYADVAAWMRRNGLDLLATAEDRALREHTGLKVEAALAPGDPRTALIRAARDAELLVVGGHGVGGVRGLLVGSVAFGVAGHAPCDVAVVHELPSLPRAEIVAGVDGSPQAHRVLESAFAEAELRGAVLRTVRAWAWPHVSGFEPADAEDERHQLLDLKQTIAGHRERHPDVVVVAEVIHGHPVAVLREAAQGADLLVVGSHGHGTFAGMLLGSVSQALVQQAPCPLIVVRRETVEQS